MPYMSQNSGEAPKIERELPKTASLNQKAGETPKAATESPATAEARGQAKELQTDLSKQLNKPASLDGKKLISYHEIAHLAGKDSSELSDHERQLYSSYLMQQADIFDEQSSGSLQDTLQGCMMRIQAIMVAFGMCGIPEDEEETPETLAKLPKETDENFEQVYKGHAALYSKQAVKVEQEYKVPMAVTIAMAAIEGSFFLKESARTSANTFNLTDEKGELIKYENSIHCFYDFGRHATGLMKDSNIDAKQPVKYLITYLQKKYEKEGKSPELINENIKDYLKQSEQQLSYLYHHDVIPQQIYQSWIEDFNTTENKVWIAMYTDQSALTVPQTLPSKDPEAHKFAIKGQAPTTSPDNAPLQTEDATQENIETKYEHIKWKQTVTNQEILTKLGPKLTAWLEESSRRMGVNPNIVAAFLHTECGFNFRAIQKRTKAQGGPQMMPEFIDYFLNKVFKKDLDSTPEVQHARGKGTILYKIKAGAPLMSRAARSGEYDPLDPYVGIFLTAAFVRNHFAALRKQWPQKMGGSFDNLSPEDQIAIVYARHNAGPGGVWKAIKNPKGGVMKVAKATSKKAKQYLAS